LPRIFTQKSSPPSEFVMVTSVICGCPIPIVIDFIIFWPHWFVIDAVSVTFPFAYEVIVAWLFDCEETIAFVTSEELQKTVLPLPALIV
jgi:hypothetical protein